MISPLDVDVRRGSDGEDGEKGVSWSQDGQPLTGTPAACHLDSDEDVGTS